MQLRITFDTQLRALLLILTLVQTVNHFDIHLNRIYGKYALYNFNT